MTIAFNTPVVCPIVIGRTSDLTTLRLLVDRAKSGEGQVVLLSGEAGIGKSRLVAEVKTEAFSHDFWLVQGSCFPTDHAIPYAPLLDLLRSHFSSHRWALPVTEVEAFAQAFFPLLPELGRLLPSGTSAPTLTPLDPEQEKRRRFETLAHFLSSQADTHPVLLVVEDLHWSDETSLEFLHYLARRCAAHRLLLLLTYRSDEVNASLRHFLAHLDRERLAQECSLARLTREEVETMLRAIFAPPRSTRLELSDSIYSLAEGNPFFVEEVLKSLIATGDLFYANGRWNRKPLGELHIPRSVQDAVELRTDRLSAPARQVLTLAAVAGRRFDFALLQALTHHDEQHLLLLIQELIAAQLVVEESADQFAFRHALTRQAIYGNLLVRIRKALHQSIADTLERLSSAPLETHLADLAYHFYEAGAWEKALLYAQRAGEQAQALYAPHAAIEQLTRALDAAHHLARGDLSPLYLARGQANETIGAFEDARSDYEQALAAAHALQERLAEWKSLIALGSLWAGRDYAQAGSYYQQALALARRMGDPLTLAHSLNRLGNWHLNAERPLEALRAHQEALATFQGIQDQHGTASTLDLLGMAHWLSGDLVQARAYYQQAIALLQHLDERQGLISSLGQLTVTCGSDMMATTLVLNFAEALRSGEQALMIAREIGQRSAEAFALSNLGSILGTRGEYERALEMMHEGLSIVEHIGHRQWLTHGHFVLGVLYRDLLDLEAAQRHLEHSLALAHEIGSENWIRTVSGMLALVYLAQQDVPRAESLLTAAQGLDLPPQTMGQWFIWSARAELALVRDNPGQALEILDQLISSAGQHSGGHRNPRLSNVHGQALAALGQAAEAEAMLQAAQEIARAHGLRPALWRICITLGKFYQTQAREAEAERMFSTARALIEDLAANVPDGPLRGHFLAQATAMLPQMRALTPNHAVRQTYGGLTARELEVLRLLAQGLTSAQIAEQLVIGVVTVNFHVRSIYRKIGVSSRSAATRYAIEHQLV
jgi:predicted ATPase/DNA-binding CsgD family transcriptional regulator